MPILMDPVEQLVRNIGSKFHRIKTFTREVSNLNLFNRC